MLTNLAGEDLALLRRELVGQLLDAPDRLVGGGTVGRRDRDGAVVLDVDLGAGSRPGSSGSSCRPGRSPHRYLSGLILIRCTRGANFDISSRGDADGLEHLDEDVTADRVRLLKRLPHDLERDALDLDIHLDGRHAIRSAGDLEVHIAVGVRSTPWMSVNTVKFPVSPSITRPIATPATAG